MFTDEHHDETNEPMPQYEPGLTFEKVWAMMQESNRKFEKSCEEWDKRFEKDREIWQKQSEEVNRKLMETARLIGELREEYKNRWGELVETLVSGNLLRLLRERGILVNKLKQRVSQAHGEPNYELDIVAQNGDEVVIVEVKSVLNPESVKHFLHQLKLVRKESKRFRQKKIIGAVAFLKEHCDASGMAINQGLLVIRATGDSAEVINDRDFVPKRF